MSLFIYSKEIMTNSWSKKQKGQVSRATLASNKLENKRSDFDLVTLLDQEKTYHVCKQITLIMSRTRIQTFLGASIINEQQSFKLIAAESGTPADSVMMKFPTTISFET